MTQLLYLLHALDLLAKLINPTIKLIMTIMRIIGSWVKYFLIVVLHGYKYLAKLVCVCVCVSRARAPVHYFYIISYMHKQTCEDIEFSAWQLSTSKSIDNVEMSPRSVSIA